MPKGWRVAGAGSALGQHPVAGGKEAATFAAAGIRGVLNFAPTVLRLPPAVSLVSVDLAIQLEQLAFLVQSGAGTAAAFTR